MPQNNSFATFAREVSYTPPPDSKPLVEPSTPSRANWFASSSATTSGGSGTQYGETSYQAGGIPTWGDSYGSGGDEETAASGLNEWETRFGWRVDFEAALAYLLGPISALLLLILETKNDFIRFHAYQSAVFSTGFLIVQFILRYIFPKWLSIVLFVWFLLSILSLAARAYRDATSSSVGQGGLTRYHLPYIGDLADRWVGEE